VIKAAVLNPRVRRIDEHKIASSNLSHGGIRIFNHSQTLYPRVLRTHLAEHAFHARENISLPRLPEKWLRSFRRLKWLSGVPRRRSTIGSRVNYRGQSDGFIPVIDRQGQSKSIEPQRLVRGKVVAAVCPRNQPLPSPGAPLSDILYRSTTE
jgi:hypothetical protein